MASKNAENCADFKFFYYSLKKASKGSYAQKTVQILSFPVLGSFDTSFVYNLFRYREFFGLLVEIFKICVKFCGFFLPKMYFIER